MVFTLNDYNLRLYQFQGHFTFTAEYSEMSLVDMFVTYYYYYLEKVPKVETVYIDSCFGLATWTWCAVQR